ncbi:MULTISPECIES: YheV family putative zinc ribbon protein [unclassified Oleiphilus]|jgi:uncharacterized metal-binding protein (TIGR02443 family)|uniref:YheV family putative zinc ribbon protein n=1 Tax=unclassified Oleiphilus TaxID=2631174 RepID=UPI0007C3B2C2|nr:MULTISPECIES: YheV family putative zinc ribbon protein [unclassified Oleiphilus]KZY41819.1 hypothetical protein A3732_02875 [Oleiphilus sp. HI0050]KZY77074.1 hypothetical protein A3740_01605 [Oleiphilus sp. HI0068]KZY81104.1 hypothetical protein A3741_04785 [Oleiphilus sp. HI0069]KZY89927.1 hypothetical protein A3743_07755 [Oleiphilus sp. HI0072]KZZ11871.1 hypothetical protein A3749_07805 [Oleiphilus sp. HI0078]KZZ24401.1 hypothetical protein A3752_05255 [Oleiphilus sp. HI0081]KZZ32243.1 
MTQKITKRFIAGAVCPRCGEMDKLVTYSSDEGTFKECVACDFTEKQIAQVEMSELDTRVNHIPSGPDDEQAQIVQIVELKPK